MEMNKIATVETIDEFIITIVGIEQGQADAPYPTTQIHRLEIETRSTKEFLEHILSSGLILHSDILAAGGEASE